MRVLPVSLRAAGGWCAPEDARCKCGAALTGPDPHHCPLIDDARPALDLPSVGVRRGGIQRPSLPSWPTIAIRRLPHTRWRCWRRRRWTWFATIPDPLRGEVGTTTRTLLGARRAATAAVTARTGVEAQTTVKR
jgi:hypothetical protein